MNFKTRNLVFLILAILWMIGIFCFSARNADLSTQDSHRIGYAIGRIINSDFDQWDADAQYEFAENIDFGIRKTAHATEYAILASLWFLTVLGLFQAKFAGMPFVIAWLITTAYAATDEFHQLFVPGRSGKVTDVCIDSCGAIVGLLICFLISKLVKKHQMKKKNI